MVSMRDLPYLFPPPGKAATSNRHRGHSLTDSPSRQPSSGPNVHTTLRLCACTLALHPAAIAMNWRDGDHKARSKRRSSSRLAQPCDGMLHHYYETSNSCRTFSMFWSLKSAKEKTIAQLAEHHVISLTYLFGLLIPIVKVPLSSLTNLIEHRLNVFN